MIKARKSLGQNFLVDYRIASRIVDSVEPLPSDIVFEIGPGTGALTRLLVERAGFVVAVEIDTRLAQELRGAISNERLAIIEADAMKIDLASLIEEARGRWKQAASDIGQPPRVRVVANLPYYISTPLIERFLRMSDELYDLTLMLQKEVVDRIVSPPGSRQRGYLSVLVQFYCEARRLFLVPPAAFRPAPKVQSAVISLKLKRDRLLAAGTDEQFFAVVKAAFSQRRKTILNSLKSSRFARVEEALRLAGIDPKRRAETIALEEFRDLFIRLREG